MKLKQKKDQQTDLYALALLLAEAQSRNQQDRQTNFINNLSRICDQFATGRKKETFNQPYQLSQKTLLHT